MEDYNEACEDAAAAVKEALQQLCDKLLVCSQMHGPAC